MRALGVGMGLIGVLSVLEIAVCAQTVLIPVGADWSFLDQGVAPAADWNSIGFDDMLWSPGQAPLGYGDGDEVTVISFGPDPDNKFITSWFRHPFQVADPSQIQNLRLRVLRDDGAVVYLNGIEVARSNVNPGPITPSTLAQSSVGSVEEDFFFSYDVDPALLSVGDNLLAVEIHQYTGSSSDTSLDLDFIANVSPSVIRGPYLQLGSSGGVTVCWRTDIATDGRVQFGSAPGLLNQFVIDSDEVQDHFVRLTGLTSETEFFYAVGTSTTMLAGDDVDHSFKTAPLPGTARPTRVWVLGDCGTANAIPQAVRDAYESVTGTERTDLVLLLGDNAYNNGADGEYEFAIFQTFTDMLRKSVFWSTRGNHEKSELDYFSIFELPTAGEAGGLPSGTEHYYAFDHGNVHFVCLDSLSSDRSVGGAMWTWAEADLASTNGEWIVAFWHHPAYTKGSHDSDLELNLIEMRTNFLPLLESYGVDIVLAGHSHSYERSFLINGHYLDSSTWDATTMLIDGGDGRATGSGIYKKPLGPNQGTAYLTAGCSGKTSAAGTLDHPAMYYSARTLGSAVLEFDGNQLDVQFINVFEEIEDQFTLRKEIAFEADQVSLSLSAGGTQTMILESGSGRAGDVYWVFGSGTGTAPGIDFGGGVILPLNYDAYFRLTLFKPFVAIFGDFLGVLDAEGAANAAFHLPPGSDPAFAGATLWHAYLTASMIGGAEFASNAISLTLDP